MSTSYLESTAILSQDTRYRYALTRIWSEGPKKVVYVLLNPSTANESKDDKTLEQCVFFAKREGFDGLELVNLFALRSTKPSVLKDDWVASVGPENDRRIERAAMSATKIVVAWGEFNSMGRDQAVLRILRQYGDLYCFGITKEGHPKHPCRLAHNTPLQLFMRSSATKPSGVESIRSESDG